MEGFEKPRKKSLLEHFSEMEDFRENWRLAANDWYLHFRPLVFK